MENLFMKLKRKRDELNKKTPHLRSGKLLTAKEKPSDLLDNSLPLLKHPPRQKDQSQQRFRDFSMQDKLIEHSLESSYRKALTRDNDAIRTIFTKLHEKRKFDPSLHTINSNQNRFSNIHLKYQPFSLFKQVFAETPTFPRVEDSAQRRGLEYSREPMPAARELSAARLKDPQPFGELSFGQKARLSEASRRLIFMKNPSNESLFTFSKILYVGLLYYKQSERDTVEYFPKECSLSFPSLSKRVLPDNRKVLFIEPMYTLANAQLDPDTGAIRFLYRRHSCEFIKRLAEHYDLVLYSSREMKYLNKIKNDLDPEGSLIRQVLDYESCIKTSSGRLIKYLQIVKNRPLREMVLLDYKIQNISKNLNNGVCIYYWEAARDDDYLMGECLEYLIQASKAPDICVFNASRLNYLELLEKL